VSQWVQKQLSADRHLLLLQQDGMVRYLDLSGDQASPKAVIDRHKDTTDEQESNKEHFEGRDTNHNKGNTD
jgi:hypothetical protein